MPIDTLSLRDAMLGAGRKLELIGERLVQTSADKKYDLSSIMHEINIVTKDLERFETFQERIEDPSAFNLAEWAKSTRDKAEQQVKNGNPNGNEKLKILKDLAPRLELYGELARNYHCKYATNLPESVPAPPENILKVSLSNAEKKWRNLGRILEQSIYKNILPKNVTMKVLHRGEENSRCRRCKESVPDLIVSFQHKNENPVEVSADLAHLLKYHGIWDGTMVPQNQGEEAPEGRFFSNDYRKEYDLRKIFLENN